MTLPQARLLRRPQYDVQPCSDFTPERKEVRRESRCVVHRGPICGHNKLYLRVPIALILLDDLPIECSSGTLPAYHYKLVSKGSS